MADGTKIEWADATVNAINGCSVTSPGCTNCYAMKLAGTRMKTHPTRKGLTIESKAGPVWNGEVRLHEPALLQPLSWSKPRRIFWNAHGDTFHDAVPDEWIDRVMAVCALTPQHTHMILTKRSKRMREYFTKVRVCDGVCDSMSIVWDVAQNLAIEHGLLDRYQPTVRVLPNVWLGVSVEDQTRADERREDFRNTPAAVKFVSYEPALGYVNWAGWAFVGQIIGGGESGPNARPPHPEWFRDTRDWCAAHGVHYFHKQWGNWAPVCEMSEELLEDIYHPAPKHDPEASRRCKVDQCVLHRDGTRFNGKAMYELGAFWQGTGAMTMFEVGKKRAGRLLDGVEHNGMPQVQHG